MFKENNMNIARRICRELANLKIANPNSDAPLANVDANTPWAKKSMKISESKDPQVALKMAMAASLGAAIIAKQKLGANVSSKSKEYIIEEGKQVIEMGKARCDQCAAAVIYKILQEYDFKSPYIEMIGNTKHCWLLCGRAGADDPSTINKIETWGDEAFLIDLWFGIQYQNMESSVIADPSNNDYTREWANYGGLFVLQTFDEWDYPDSGGSFWS